MDFDLTWRSSMRPWSVSSIRRIPVGHVPGRSAVANKLIVSRRTKNGHTTVETGQSARTSPTASPLLRSNKKSFYSAACEQNRHPVECLFATKVLSTNQPFTALQKLCGGLPERLFSRSDWEHGTLNSHSSPNRAYEQMKEILTLAQNHTSHVRRLNFQD